MQSLNLFPFLPKSYITIFFVGNKIMPTADHNLITHLVPAMHSLHATLAEAGLTRSGVSDEATTTPVGSIGKATQTLEGGE